jgi:hypothetical protein
MSSIVRNKVRSVLLNGEIEEYIVFGIDTVPKKTPGLDNE